MELLEVGLNDDALLLDLLNTTPVTDGRQRDILADRVQAGIWLRERGATEAELPELVEARNVLQAVVSGAETAAALAPLLDAVALRARAMKGGVRCRDDAAARRALRENRASLGNAAYTEGDVIADGASIGLDRTAVPVEWDEVKEHATGRSRWRRHCRYPALPCPTHR